MALEDLVVSRGGGLDGGGLSFRLSCPISPSFSIVLGDSRVPFLRLVVFEDSGPSGRDVHDVGKGLSGDC